MTRSHTAKNNNGMGDRRYATNGLNNNRVVGSSPSKLELSVNNNEPCNTNEDVKTENRVTQKNTKTIKSNSSTPTKKSVANSILSFTSSFLAAAAASSTATEILPMSPTQSPTKERHQVIDLSSNHSTPLKRASTPSASPTRRGGRATKPSPHQGTPPQSPPTPHKIICQSTVETIEPTIQSTASDDDNNEKGQQNYSSSRIRGSPNKKKCSPGLKLISALSPKKKSSSADKKHPLDQTIPTSSEHVETETGESKTISSADEASNMSARRNLTSSFFLNNAREPTAEVNGTVGTRPKKR